MLRLLTITHVLIDGLFESMPILLSFMTLQFGYTAREAGLVVSLAVTASTFLGLATNAFSRRFGLRVVLGLVLVLMGVGFGGNAFSPGIILSGMLFVVAMSGFSVFHTLSFSAIAHGTRAGLGKAMGTFTAMGDVGRIPLASLAGYLGAMQILGFPGWRSVCLVYGLGALTFAGYMLLRASGAFGSPTPGTADAPGSGRLLPSFGLLRERRFALPVAANVLDAVGSDQIFIFLPYLLLAKQFDPAMLGTFALAFTLGCFLGKSACGRLNDVFGPRKVFVAAELTMAALLVVLVLGRQLPVIIGASLLLGIVCKGTVPVIQILVAGAIDDAGRYDEAFSISAFARGVTDMAVPLLFGYIASMYGVEYIYGIMAGAAVLAAAPALLIRKTARPA